MTKERANLGFSSSLDQFNPDEWKPSPPKRTQAPADRAATTIKAAAASGFSSREPKPVQNQQETAPPPRRRRTGRNAQLNLKARPETIAAFCAIADQQGWGLGETLEKAVELLEREHGRR